MCQLLFIHHFLYPVQDFNDWWELIPVKYHRPVFSKSMKHAITTNKSMECTEIPVLWLLCKNSNFPHPDNNERLKKWRFEHYSVITDITTQASFQSDTGIVQMISRKWPLLQHACSVMSSFARSLCISRIYRSAYIMHCVYTTFALYNCQKTRA